VIKGFDSFFFSSFFPFLSFLLHLSSFFPHYPDTLEKQQPSYQPEFPFC
jgi:hypothetical protein